MRYVSPDRIGTSRRREWELSAVLSLMCHIIVSTNRSLGGQPGIKSRRIFCSSPPGPGRRGLRAKNTCQLAELKIMKKSLNNS